MSGRKSAGQAASNITRLLCRFCMISLQEYDKMSDICHVQTRLVHENLMSEVLLVFETCGER